MPLRGLGGAHRSSSFAWLTTSASHRERIDLQRTLHGGQCFRWQQTPRHSWIGVLGNIAVEIVDAKDLLAAAGKLPVRVDNQSSRSQALGRTAKATAVPEGVLFRLLAQASVPKHRATKAGAGRARAAGVSDSLDDVRRSLRHYLSLDVNIDSLWRRWTVDNPHKAHPLVSHLTAAHQETPPAIHHLRQDIHETLFAFLCSQNNHVRRITAMVESLASEYGDLLCHYNMDTGEVATVLSLPGQAKAVATPSHSRSSARSKRPLASGLAGDSAAWVPLYRFPTVDQLQTATEEQLRSLGFGYRSKYIVASAQRIALTKVGESTDTSSFQFYRQLVAGTMAKEQQRDLLVALPGVGRKVADCILLFALDRPTVVPVDTHMAQIAHRFLCMECPSRTVRKVGRDSTPKKSAADCDTAAPWREVLGQWADPGRRSRKGAADPDAMPPLLPRHHDAIQRAFEELFGSHCGLAHSVLFYERLLGAEQ